MFQVILIADLRENNAKFRGNTVVECMAKSEHRMDMRPLSVGDYLWVARKIDGTEVILDWIVERKTWSDLHQSIRSGRYEEQKQRLRRSPMKNRVYLVEGTLSPQYSACEQALATTMVIDGFMIQRTRSPHDSAQFLMRLTEYLKRMVTSRQVQVLPTVPRKQMCGNLG
ncbi:ERCC4 domain protein, partial [Trichostrongylus colubriformis]